VTSGNPPDAIRGLYVWSVRRWYAEGLTPKRLRTLVRDGDLIRTRRGVYATRKAMEYAKRDAKHAHAIAAISEIRLTTGGIVSHHSAALLHGLDMLHPPDMSRVSMTFQRGGGQRNDGIVRYRARLTNDQVEKVFGILVTSVARTVIDIARISTFMQGVVIADSALRNAVTPGENGTTKDQLRAVLGTCAGWPGSTLAERVVEFADESSESVLESCARVVFHEHGLERPELQAWIPGTGYRVDFLWPEYKVIAEADGLAKYEEDPKRKIADQIKRDGALRKLGYELVHFTWADLFNSPRKIIKDILDAKQQQQRRSHGGGG
jgi:very-short-patch-repair endonuclease